MDLELRPENATLNYFWIFREDKYKILVRFRQRSEAFRARETANWEFSGRWSPGDPPYKHRSTASSENSRIAAVGLPAVLFSIIQVRGFVHASAELPTFEVIDLL